VELTFKGIQDFLRFKTIYVNHQLTPANIGLCFIQNTGIGYILTLANSVLFQL